MADASDWITICRSGPTADGRTITPEQLREAAEAYDAKGTYLALINVEHVRAYSPASEFRRYGHVLALRAVDLPTGAAELHAQLHRDPDLTAMQATGQKSMWSAELQPNFAGSGRYYLVGLAATDDPASLGTKPMQLSAQQQAAQQQAAPVLYCTAIPHTQKAPMNPEEQQKTLLSKLAEALGISAPDAATPNKDTLKLSQPAPAPAPVSTDAGTLLLGMLTQQVKDLAAKVEALSTASQPPQKPEPEAEKQADAAPATEEDPLTKLSKQVAELTEAFAKTDGGKKIGAHTGADDTATIVF